MTIRKGCVVSTDWQSLIIVYLATVQISICKVLIDAHVRCQVEIKGFVYSSLVAAPRDYYVKHRYYIAPWFTVTLRCGKVLPMARAMGKFDENTLRVLN